jgi:flagellar biosynthesis/type III secretory pathway protein FliH
MTFTARRILIGEGEDAMRGGLVYRREDVAQMCDVASLINRARRAASSIVKDARKTAKMHAVRSAAMRRARKREADRAFIARATALEEAYRLTQISLTSQMEATLDCVLAAALTRIGIELPAEQRLRVVCEELAKVAGPVEAARLRLCQADASVYRSADIGFEWPLQIDDGLMPGDCRLVTDRGEWSLEFDALLASLAPIGSSNRRDEDATDD